jgi:hypothetical protein
MLDLATHSRENQEYRGRDMLTRQLHAGPSPKEVLAHCPEMM